MIYPILLVRNFVWVLLSIKVCLFPMWYLSTFLKSVHTLWLRILFLNHFEDLLLSILLKSFGTWCMVTIDKSLLIAPLMLFVLNFFNLEYLVDQQRISLFHYFIAELKIVLIHLIWLLLFTSKIEWRLLLKSWCFVNNLILFSIYHMWWTGFDTHLSLHRSIKQV